MADGVELLWGLDAFWERAQADIAGARRRLFVQAMTFEGDGAGRRMADAIFACGAVDRRVLVDAYTRHVVSDRFVWSPGALLDRGVRQEVRATKGMFAALARDGVAVRMTNPMGPLLLRYPARNHKKLILADDVAYIGGLNFSDHNFAWTDLMIRIDNAQTARFLGDDFAATFSGAPRSAIARIGVLALYSMDGRANAAAFDEVMGIVDRAAREITVVSPYVTFPFLEVLARAGRRGVAVRLVTPATNNKPTAARYALAQAARHGFEVRLAPAMSHVKAICIDGEHLIAGSSNFDFVSLAAEEELVAVISSKAVAAEFERLLQASLAGFQPPANQDQNTSSWSATLILRLADLVARGARGARRTAIPWR